MKCANCGAELKVGCIYCSVCGREAQIVSDYNLLEDDFLRDVLKENEKKQSKEIPKKESHDNVSSKSSGQAGKKGKGSRRPKKRLIFAVTAMFLLIFLVAGIVMAVNYGRDHSFEYQMQQAEECIADMNYRKAERFAVRALELKEEDAQAMLLLAEIYRLQGETGRAETILQDMCAKQKDNKEAYQALIELYGEEKAYDSIQKLSEGVEDPDIQELFFEYVPQAPEFDTEDGVYEEELLIEIEAKQGEVYYTMDGSDPRKGKEYQGSIQIMPGEKVRIRAVAKSSYGLFGQEAEGKFEVELQKPAMPQVTPTGGNFYNSETISVTVPQGCRVYYTWDGSVPNEDSKQYTGPLQMPEGNNILSLVLIDQYGMRSDIRRCNYIYIP